MHLTQWTEKIPEQPALIFGERDLTVSYAELEAASNRVAQALPFPDDGSVTSRHDANRSFRPREHS